MKRIFLSAFALIIIHSVFSQSTDSIRQAKRTDSLKKELAASKKDSNRVKILIALAGSDTVQLQKALELAQEIKDKRLQSQITRALGLRYALPAKSLELYLKALDLSESVDAKDETARNYRNIGRLYNGLKDYTKSRYYLFQSKDLFREAHSNDSCITLFELGEMFYSIGRNDSALLFYQQAYKIGLTENPIHAVRSLTGIGKIYADRGDYITAMKYLRQSVERLNLLSPYYILTFSPDIFLPIARIFQLTGQRDSSFFYAKQAYDNAKAANQKAKMATAGKFLFEYYDGKNDMEAYKYLKLFTNISDSLNPVERARQVQEIALEEGKRRQAIEAARIESKNRTQLFTVSGGLLAVLIIAVILFRNNRQKQKANRRLVQQQAELRATQAQLVQSEKMASLGELAAGIAHEIQNPLNFVNNFSDVNAELIEELRMEANKGNIEEVKIIAANIKENEEKISHHGKRADVIVKGMLQHSRSSPGKKEPTDINALADEYLRLSYHGLRAKDKDFNAGFKTNFDESLGKVEVVPQDVGRVLLNLYNNAFYAVNAKAKRAGEGYQPEVIVTTAKQDRHVLIIVHDNGNGIPQNILDKIFQPFFTTKPTGEGTGLGLSLSYDIITKGHGGEIKVTSKEGKETEFIIRLPL